MKKKPLFLLLLLALLLTAANAEAQIAASEWNEGVIATSFSCRKSNCVALPSRLALGKRVEVCSSKGCVTAVVADVGPWCRQDDPYVLGNSRPFAEQRAGENLDDALKFPEAGEDTLDCRTNPKVGGPIPRKSNGAGIDLSVDVDRELGNNGKGIVSWRFIDDPTNSLLKLIDTARKSQQESIPNIFSASISSGAPLDFFRGKTVLIDVGHGGRDPGAVFTTKNGQTVNEKDMALSYSNKLKEVLESNGARVLMTRETDVYLSLSERVDIINREKPDVAISMHINSARLPVFRGTPLVFVACLFREEGKNGNGLVDIAEFASFNQLCQPNPAESHQGSVIVASNVTNKLSGFLTGMRVADATVLVRSNSPVVLFEVGFGSNKDELERMLTPLHQTTITLGLAAAIQDYLGKTKKAAVTGTELKEIELEEELDYVVLNFGDLSELERRGVPNPITSIASGTKFYKNGNEVDAFATSIVPDSAGSENKLAVYRLQQYSSYNFEVKLTGYFDNKVIGTGSFGPIPGKAKPELNANVKWNFAGEAAGNVAPTAVANDINAVKGKAVLLDASRSFDSDGTIEGYLWLDSSHPDESPANGKRVAEATVSAVFNTLGEHLVILYVTDDKGATGSETFYVNVAKEQEGIVEEGAPRIERLVLNYEYSLRIRYNEDGTIRETDVISLQLGKNQLISAAFYSPVEFYRAQLELWAFQEGITPSAASIERRMIIAADERGTNAHEAGTDILVPIDEGKIVSLDEIDYGKIGTGQWNSSVKEFVQKFKDNQYYFRVETRIEKESNGKKVGSQFVPVSISLFEELPRIESCSSIRECLARGSQIVSNSLLRAGEQAEEFEGLKCVQLEEGKQLDVVSAPCISAERIDEILAANDSPAAGTGKAFYDYGLKYGIDPTVALAFFREESTFGKFGAANRTKSIGNIRYYDTADPNDAAYCPTQRNDNGFCSYDSWEQGIEHFYKYINGPLYVAAGNNTLEEIVPIYISASSTETSSIISKMRSWLAEWREQ